MALIERSSDLMPSVGRVGLHERGASNVVFCTARIDASGDTSSAADQDIYLKALQASGSVDVIEYGYYVARVKRAPLATPDRKGRPVLTTSQWPVMVRHSNAADVQDAAFMVSYA